MINTYFLEKKISSMIPVSYKWETIEEFQAQRHWLWNNLSDDDYQPYGTDPQNYKRCIIYFKHPQDAFWFALRWS